MEPKNGIKTWQWVVTAIVIIVLIVIGVIVFGNKGPETPGSDTASTDTGALTAAKNSVTLSDQYPGNVIYVSTVELAAPGWVVIHKDASGQPGAVIGSLYFDKGLSPGGKVVLTEKTTEGGTYYAMLHSDDGDKKFDATKDLPLKGVNGMTIMRIFHASASVGNEIKG